MVQGISQSITSLAWQEEKRMFHAETQRAQRKNGAEKEVGLKMKGKVCLFEVKPEGLTGL